MSYKRSLELHFGNLSSPELYRTVFFGPGIEEPIVGVRGAVIPTVGHPFIWGPSSQSLSLLFVGAVRHHLESKQKTPPVLEGPSSSPAGILARLLQKRTNSWLHDLFGTDASGRSLLHRIIVLVNPRGRRIGPISAGLRTEYLAPSNIKVLLEGKDISNDKIALKELFDSLLSSYTPRKDPLAKKRIQNSKNDITSLARDDEVIAYKGAA